MPRKRGNKPFSGRSRKKKVKPNFAEYTDAGTHARNVDGSTELHTACKRGYIELADHLISRGSEINKVDKQGYTPLDDAILAGQLDCARWLLRHPKIVIPRSIWSFCREYGAEHILQEARYGCDDFPPCVAVPIDPELIAEEEAVCPPEKKTSEHIMQSLEEHPDFVKQQGIKQDVKQEVFDQKPDLGQQYAPPQMQFDTFKTEFPEEESDEVNMDKRDVDPQFQYDNSQPKTETLHEDEIEEGISENCAELFFKEEIIEPGFDLSNTTAIVGQSEGNEETIQPEKPFGCSHCQYRCKNKTRLAEHMKHVHSDERPYNCLICQHRSKSRSNLRQHMKHAHCNEKPFSCPQCQYTCKSMSSLNNHTHRVHSDGKPFSCSQCQYNCKRKYDLTRHSKQVHSKEKPFSCSQCQFKCKTNADLSRHLKHVHSNKRPFSCSRCKSTFKNKSSLNSHLKLSHSDL